MAHSEKYFRWSACERWGMKPEDFFKLPSDRQVELLAYETIRKAEENEQQQSVIAAVMLSRR